jgi:hypothetical protein
VAAASAGVENSQSTAHFRNRIGNHELAQFLAVEMWTVSRILFLLAPNFGNYFAEPGKI